jgi:membrane protease subunit (stomatin/prohibitin family)
MAEQQQQQAEMDPAANRAAAQQAAPAPAAGDDPVAKIKQLAELRDSGVLTEQEFTAAKAKLLGV